MRILQLLRNASLAVAVMALAGSVGAQESDDTTCYDPDDVGTICEWCSSEECTTAFCPDGIFIWCDGGEGEN